MNKEEINTKLNFYYSKLKFLDYDIAKDKDTFYIKGSDERNVLLTKWIEYHKAINILQKKYDKLIIDINGISRFEHKKNWSLYLDN